MVSFSGRAMKVALMLALHGHNDISPHGEVHISANAATIFLRQISVFKKWPSSA